MLSEADEDDSILNGNLYWQSCAWVKRERQGPLLSPPRMILQWSSSIGISKTIPAEISVVSSYKQIQAHHNMIVTPREPLIYGPTCNNSWRCIWHNYKSSPV